MNCLPPHFEMGTKADVSFQGKKKLLKYLVSSTQMRTTELFSSRTSYSYYLSLKKVLPVTQYWN